MEKSVDVFLLILTVTVILLLLIATIVSLIFIYQNRQIRDKLELRRVKATHEHEILKTRLEIREQTFHDISVELHDNVGQVLALANLNLTSLKLDEHGDTGKKVNVAVDLIAKAVGDLRNLSRMLTPDGASGLTLSESLGMEVSLLEKTKTFSTKLQLKGSEPVIDPFKRLFIYRIAQEAINNIIKHSRATEIHLALEFGDTTLCLTVSDNGIGFSSPVEPGKGAGLKNMKKRAQLMGGTFEVKSGTGQGTQLHIIIPLDTQPHEIKDQDRAR